MSKSHNNINSLFNHPVFIQKSPNIKSIRKHYPTLDPYFIYNGLRKYRASAFDELWINFRPYADSNFLTEIETKFHQKTWEMYIGNALLNKNIKISSYDEGPDFIIKNDKNKDELYIECVCPEKGTIDNPDAVPDPIYNSQGVLQNYPDDQMILRITDSIDKKIKQYNKWLQKKGFSSEIPYIIAINSAGLECRDDIFIPNIIKALFGAHQLQQSINGTVAYLSRDYLIKENGRPIEVNLFTDSKKEFISGIIFSNQYVFHSKEIGDDCVFINNPYAKHPTPASFYKIFKKRWRANKKNKGLVLNRNYSH